jgi:hypothetical protein
MSIIQLESDWKDEIKKDAMRFAGLIEKSFLGAVSDTARNLPDQSHGCKEELIMTYVDAMVTTCAGICGKYVNTSGQFEDAIVNAIRDKFVILRKMQLEGKMP